MCYATASILVAMILVVLGYTVPRLLPFTENVLAEVIGIAAGFALAVWVIERRTLTQQDRQRKILVRRAISIAQEAGEIGQMIIWEIANSLSSELNLSIGLDEEVMGDSWDDDVKPLLRKVFSEAESIGEEDIVFVDALPYEHYRSRIVGIEGYVQRIRSRFEANLEIHESLLELSEAFDALDQILTRCMWPSRIRTEVDRYQSSGRVGNALVSLVEAIDDVHFRYSNQMGKAELIRIR